MCESGCVCTLRSPCVHIVWICTCVCVSGVWVLVVPVCICVSMSVSVVCLTLGEGTCVLHMGPDSSVGMRLKAPVCGHVQVGIGPGCALQ